MALLTGAASSSSTVSTNKVKGQTFKSCFDVYERLFGSPVKDALIATLPKDLADALRFGAIVSSGWSPIHWYTTLYEAHDKLRGHSPGFARKMGRLTTEQDFRGVYAFIVRLASPSTVFANAQRLLKLYVQQCSVTTVERSDTHVRTAITMQGSSDAMWEEFCGGSEAILLVNGAHEPHVTVTRTNDDSVVVHGAWKLR
jgi:hypothetical protein